MEQLSVVFETISAGWFVVAVVVPAFVPAGGVWVMRMIDGILRSKGHTRGVGTAMSLMAPYIDGQMGYVAVAWAAGALWELDTLIDHASSNYSGQVSAGLWVLLCVSGLIAAAGSLPSPHQPTEPSMKQVTRRFYDLPCISSLVTSVLTLVLMMFTHATVLRSVAPGDSICP